MRSGAADNLGGRVRMTHGVRRATRAMVLRQGWGLRGYFLCRLCIARMGKTHPSQMIADLSHDLSTRAKNTHIPTHVEALQAQALCMMNYRRNRQITQHFVTLLCR